MPTHEKFMQRAIELANRAAGNTSPNPLVGAVIVRDGKVVAEGWHKQAGDAHAEVDAIRDAAQKQQPTKGATLYVSLEPCAHYGQTPPCTEAILKAGFSDVVFATSDTHSQASGGAQILKSAGVNVHAGVCEELARYTNRFFFHYQQYKTPFVIAKFASSLDGRTATRTGNSQWITGNAARQRGHVARQAADAIVVGAQTAIDDQPQLTVRNPDAYIYTQVAHPLRIVLDSAGRVPLDNAVFDSSLPASTLLVTTHAMPETHATQLQDKGVEVLRLPCSGQSAQPDLNALLEALGNRNIQSLLVEGGQTVLGSFFDLAAVNEVWAFLAPILIGGTSAMPCIGGLGIDELNTAAVLRNISVERLDADLLIKGLVAYSGLEAPKQNNAAYLKSNLSDPITFKPSNTERLNLDNGESLGSLLHKSEAS